MSATFGNSLRLHSIFLSEFMGTQFLKEIWRNTYSHTLATIDGQLHEHL